MYEFITHTWNTVKGRCPHDCSYCYMKRWGKLNQTRFDKKELKTDIGEGNIIFVGSSCDMWAEEIPDSWIETTLNHCRKFDNKYFFQTKNPKRIWNFYDDFLSSDKVSFCTTIETNRFYEEYMGDTPTPTERALEIGGFENDRYVTIEPIMDFDIDELLKLMDVLHADPMQVNIGADSGRHGLPEPEAWKIEKLIKKLNKFTTVNKKKNLKRLLT